MITEKNIICILGFFLLTCCGVRHHDIPKNGDWKHVTERPYVDRGNLYVPQLHYSYDKEGYASWYGSDFHGAKTALGIRYDMYGMTAAHRTLPLPSVVRVTNLENDRSVVLIVNDRGPFRKTDKRLIDVSKKAAQLLGFVRQGRARVRVTCLRKESAMLAKVMGRHNYGNDKIMYVGGSKKSGTSFVSDKIGGLIKKIVYAKNLLLK